MMNLLALAVTVELVAVAVELLLLLSMMAVELAAVELAAVELAAVELAVVELAVEMANLDLDSFVVLISHLGRNHHQLGPFDLLGKIEEFLKEKKVLNHFL